MIQKNKKILFSLMAKKKLSKKLLKMMIIVKLIIEKSNKLVKIFKIKKQQLIIKKLQRSFKRMIKIKK